MNISNKETEKWNIVYLFLSFFIWNKHIIGYKKSNTKVT